MNNNDLIKAIRAWKEWRKTQGPERPGVYYWNDNEECQISISS